MISPRWRSVIVSLLGLGILVGIAYYLFINASEYQHLLQISTLGVSAIFILSFAVPVFNGLINVYMFQNLGANLSLQEGFYLAASASLANQLPIPGGIITRAVYLKYRYGLSYSQYLSASLALFFCGTAVSGFIGIGVLLYWLLFTRIAVSYLLFIGFAAMAACVLVFFVPISRVKLPGRMGKWVDQAVQGWVLISRNPFLLVKLLGLQTGFMLLFAVRQWMAFHMLSQPMTLSQAILLSCGNMMTQLISFAPGGLGAREAIVGAIAIALNFDLAVSIAAVELDRVISTILILLTGGISVVVLGNRFSDKVKIDESPTGKRS